MKKYTLLFVFLSGITHFVNAQILDQINASTYNSGWIVNYDAYSAVGQSFISGYSGELSKVAISIDTPSVSYPVISGTFQLNVYSGSGFTGSLLATESFFVPTGLPYGDFEISLSTIVNLTAGNQYTFSVEEISGTGQIQLNATANNYSSGSLFNTILTSTTPFPTYDLLFKTYVKVNSYSTLDITECFAYTSPSGLHVWNTSGTYLDTIPNTLGGDSIITVNLTIQTIDVSVVNNYTSLMANATSATYQWLDCKDGMAVIPGEIAQSFAPSGGGQFAVAITQGGCTDTSACESVTAVSITEADEKSKLEIYPNPTTGTLQVNFGNAEFQHVRLISAIGQPVFESDIIQPGIWSFQIDGASGIYWLEFTDENNNTELIRVIKL